MGTVPHHQAQARRFLKLARADLNAGHGPRAANALARAASHAVTAAVRHWNPTLRPTRRKLTNAFFALAFAGQVTHGGVRTFRQIYRLPAAAAAGAADSRAAHQMLRRARNRVSALLRSVAQAIAGRPAGARPRQPSLIQTPQGPIDPASLTTLAAIRSLPGFAAVAEANNLTRLAVAKRPDPHGFYRLGCDPRPCACHPETRAMPGDANTCTLSPLWQQALEQAYGVKFPTKLTLLPR